MKKGDIVADKRNHQVLGTVAKVYKGKDQWIDVDTSYARQGYRSDEVEVVKVSPAKPKISYRIQIVDVVPTDEGRVLVGSNADIIATTYRRAMQLASDEMAAGKYVRVVKE